MLNKIDESMIDPDFVGKVNVGKVNVKDFGAVGDGIANDRLAIMNSIEFAITNKIFEIVFPGIAYNVGNLSNGEIVFPIVNTSNIKLSGKNTKIICNTTDNTSPKLFGLDNVSFIEFDGFQVIDNGLNLDVNWKGIAVFELKAAIGDIHNIKFNNLSIVNVVAFLRTVESNFTVNTIFFDNILIKGSYYGINCSNAGDNFKGEIKTDNVKRSYFVYGVDGHDISIDSSNKVVSFNDVLIKDYGKPTRNLRIKYRGYNNSANSYGVSFETQSEDGTGIIENVEIDFDDTLNTGDHPSILFTSYTGAGVKESTTTNRFNNIRLKGMARNGINMSVKQLTKGRIEIDPSIHDLVNGISDENWDGFDIFTTSNIRSPIKALTQDPISPKIGDIWLIINNVLKAPLRIMTENGIKGLQFFDPALNLNVAKVEDSFNRQNSTNSLGFTETGQLWESQGVNNVWGIDNNQAYPVTSQYDSPIFVETDISNNVAFQAIASVYHSSNQLMWRISNTEKNYFCIQGNEVNKVVNDSWVILKTLPTILSNDVIRVELRGDVHHIFINGVSQFSFIDTAHLTETKFGFSTNSVTTRLDSFLVEPIIPSATVLNYTPVAIGSTITEDTSDHVVATSTQNGQAVSFGIVGLKANHHYEFTSTVEILQTTQADVFIHLFNETTNTLVMQLPVIAIAQYGPQEFRIIFKTPTTNLTDAYSIRFTQDGPYSETIEYKITKSNLVLIP